MDRPNLGAASIIRANSRHLPLADNTVDLVVTSPPYFALRSYQDGGEHYAGQIGDEPTPDEFVSSLLEVTAECVRVLKPSGSLWVNLGDKYASSGTTPIKRRSDDPDSYVQTRGLRTRPTSEWFPHKSLMGLPWRYALRCIDDLGLILRAEVIWSKPNGLPESVTDRVRRSHETWFHFTLNPRYFSAVDEIREQATATTKAAMTYAERLAAGESPRPTRGVVAGTNGRAEYAPNPLGKLPSSVWEINEEESLVRCVLSAIHAGSLTIDEGERLLKGQAWTGAHDSGARSTSPVTAGSGRQDARPRDTASSGSTAGQSSRTESPLNSATDPSLTDSNSTTSAASGIASGTLSPSLSATTSCAGQAPSPPSMQPRPTAATGTSSRTPTPTDPQTEAACAESACEQRTAAPTGERSAPRPDAPGSVWTIATEPLRVPDHLGIDHFAAFPTAWPRKIISAWCPEGGTVLDPFGGTGTTAMVAKALGRHGISVDMSADYCRLAEWRVNDRDQIAKVLGVAKADPVHPDETSLFDLLDTTA